MVRRYGYFNMNFLSTSSAHTQTEQTESPNGDEPPLIPYLPVDNDDVVNGPHNTAVQIMRVVDHRAHTDGRKRQDVARNVLNTHNYHRTVDHYVRSFSGLEEVEEETRRETEAALAA